MISSGVHQTDGQTDGQEGGTLGTLTLSERIERVQPDPVGGEEREVEELARVAHGVEREASRVHPVHGVQAADPEPQLRG